MAIIYIFVSITPLIFFASLFSCFDLPKFVWIFFITCFLIFYFLKSKKDISIKNKEFLLPISLFLIWIILTGIKSINIFETYKSFLIYFLFLNFYFFSTEIFEKKDIEKILKFLILFSLFIPIYGFFQLFGYDFIKWEIKNSPLSTLGRRNFAAEYLVMIIPFTYFFILTSNNFKEKIFFIFSFFLFFLHLIFTFTRASYIGFFFSTVLFFYLLKIRLPIKKIVSIFIFFFLASSLLSYNGFEKGTIKSRIYIWKETINIFLKNPFFGVGSGNFKINFLLYAKDRPKDISLIGEVLEDVHNDFLEILVETGAIGFSIFLFLLFNIVKIFLSLIRKSKDFERILTISIFCSISGILINSLASFPLKKPSTLLVFFLCLSFLEILSSENKFYKKKFHKNFFIFYLILFFLSGFAISYRGILGNFYYKKSFDKEKLNPLYSKKMAFISIKYNPFNYKPYFMIGNFYLKEGKYDMAMIYFKKAEKLFPYIDTLQNNIGISFLKMKNYKEAEKHFLLSLRLNKHRAETYNNIGSLYIEMGKIEKAIYYLEECIKIEPNFYLAYFNLGIIYLEKNDREKAKKYFKKVLELNPNFQPVKNYLK
ncbi:MAG: tetratricopeptide repeat protein [Candidatus Omnitrophica bacterium]|nr:tetratricopeptide repeat protein [Candidatus Omnitrophota bacterium]